MTNKAPHLSVSERDLSDTPKSLRRKGLLPANVYGLSKKSKALVCLRTDFEKFLRAGGETGLLFIDVKGKKPEPALVEEIQFNPISGQALHVSFRRVDLQEKITASVPLEFSGYEDIPMANLLKIREEVEIEALPTDIPESIKVDLSKLTEIGQSILLKDLKYDRSKISLAISDEDLEKPVVVVQEQTEEVEPEVSEQVEVGGATSGDGGDAVQTDGQTDDKQTDEENAESD